MYNIERVYAIPVEKVGRIIDACSRYEWEEVAKITLPENANDAEIEAA